MNTILKSIKRTPYQSLASFLILFFTLFLSLFFFNLIAFFDGALSYVEKKPQVTVYFQSETEENEIFKIRDAIMKSGKASHIKYTSKNEALKVYKESNKDQLLNEMVSASILPPSLDILAKEPVYLSEIAEYLKKQPGIDEVDFQEDVVERLLTLTSVLRKISLFVFIFLIITSCMVLITTTAFKIAIRKKEIELLKLLGATTFYIRKPFLIEGIFFGFGSGTIAFLLFYGILFYSQPFLHSYLSGITRLPFFNLAGLGLYVWPPSAEFITMSYLLIVIFGMIIGLIGNFLSTSKYIK